MSQLKSKTKNDECPIIDAVETEAKVKAAEEKKSKEDAKGVLYLTRV
jgi:hypothetical protein